MIISIKSESFGMDFSSEGPVISNGSINIQNLQSLIDLLNIAIVNIEYYKQGYISAKQCKIEDTTTSKILHFNSDIE